MPRLKIPAAGLAVAFGLIPRLILPWPAWGAGPVRTPLAQPADGWVADPVYQKHQYLADEAASKARALAKALEPPRAAPPALGDFDAVFYDLDLHFDPPVETLTGRVTASVRVTAASLTVLTLQLRDAMTVSEVREGAIPVAFTHLNDQLEITLTRTYLTGELVTVTVDYVGDPSGNYFGWASYLGEPLIWTLSEPYGASHWWPCKDLNTDKADSVDLHLTVPEAMIAVSNGNLVAETVPEPGWKTYHWQERYPIVPYLVSVTAHAYAVITDQYQPLAGDPMPVVHYVIPAVLAAATAGYAPTVQMLEVFAAGFGEYPFVEEKYGHAHFFWGGGMEHQTCASMYYDYFEPTFIAHELAHQWFGDMITCSDFQHIWLNEGLATWAEAFWREQTEGPAAYRQEMNNSLYFGNGTIFVEDPQNVNEIFNFNLTYLKASWVVHMLRHVVGDEDFFAGLLQVRQLYGFGSLDTEQFRDVFQAVSGQDLTAFFEQWIYDEYYPYYQYYWTATPLGGGTRVIVHLTQAQVWPRLFVMPVDIRITTDQDSQTFAVPNTQQAQFYSFDVPGNVVQVALDPDNWILCQKLEVAPSEVPEAAAGIALGLTAAPNPFNPRTSIQFAIPEGGRVEVSVYDAAGRRVTTLADGFYAAGRHRLDWDGCDRSGARQASGTYFVRLLAENQARVHKITLVQ